MLEKIISAFKKIGTERRFFHKNVFTTNEVIF